MDPLIESLVALALLLLVSCLAAPLAAQLRLPHSVLLAGLGLAAGLSGISFGLLPETLTGDAAGSMQAFGLRAQDFLVLFLPPLLFSAGLHVDVRMLMDEVWAVFLLAVVAVVVTTGVVGAALVYIGDFGWIAALLLGAIIATTDPAAVVAVFRDLGATKRLRVIVEGESLLNDAAAIALFGALTTLALAGTADTAEAVALSALPAIGIGAGVGIAMARLGWFGFRLLARGPVLETTFSITIPYLTYVIAEYGLGASGVIAVAFAGLAMAADGPSRLAPGNWRGLLRLWNWIEFVVVSIVFLLSAILAARLILSLAVEGWAICILVFVAALAARALVLYGLLPLLTAAGLAQGISTRFKAVILWGGLRGAITLVLALAVMENVSLPLDFRQTIAGVAVGYVYLTLFISAPALRPLLRLSGLDRLSRREEAMRERVLAVSAARRAKQLRATARQLGMDRDTLDQAGAELGTDDTEGNTAPALPKADRLDMALVAISTRERWLYLRHFSEQMVSLRVIARLVTSAERLGDAARADGEAGYSLLAARALDLSPRLRRGVWLYRWTRVTTPLERALEDRYEFLLMRRHVLHEVQTFAETTVSQFFGEDVGRETYDILEDRKQRTADALQAMTVRFGDYTEALAAHQLARTALRLEAAEYRARLDDSLISQEVFDAQQRRLDRLQLSASARPSLELGSQLTAMISSVPVFQHLGDTDLAWMARRLELILAQPGERILQKGTKGNAVYFIAAGKVRVSVADRSIDLGEGAFFGEMAVIQKRPRGADVTALGYTHLLVLRGNAFRRLLDRRRDIRQEIEATAAARDAENAAGGTTILHTAENS